jgi:hypothetical protein
MQTSFFSKFYKKNQFNREPSTFAIMTQFILMSVFGIGSIVGFFALLNELIGYLVRTLMF